MPSEFQFYNKYHYGDSIFNLRFFYNIVSFLKANEITILYFYNPDYIKCPKELENYTSAPTVRLLPMGHPNMKDPIHLWMGDPIDGCSNVSDFIKYFRLLYCNVSTLVGLQLPPEYTSFFQPESYLTTLYDRMDEKYKKLNILVVNSAPQSSQFPYIKKKFDKICKKLVAPNRKIATTTYVEDTIPCTFKDSLSIQEIGAISTKANIIIGVLSGPMTACFNSETINHVEKIFLLCHDMFVFTHPKIQVIPTLRQLRHEVRCYFRK